MLLLTRAQVREIDRRASEEYGIPGIVLMENAALAVVHEAMRMLRSQRSPSALILVGGGNNGGDGLAAARHLHNRGVSVTIGLMTEPERFKGDAIINWKIVSTMKLPAEPITTALIARHARGLVIDALFGTGLTEPPRNPFPTIAQAVNDFCSDVLAVDVPSGLDCDTGQPLGICIRATSTVTFVAQKPGFIKSTARPYLGNVTVGDIGCPKELIDAVAGA
jgi:hydroxyethylthiazole kinase-like uncharacterized protein yjeF